MSAPKTRGVVSISIDADSGSTQSTAAGDKVTSVIVDILDRFHKHHVAGTWAFTDPAGTSLAARRITHDMPQQEVALLMAAPASGTGFSRADVLRSVVRRLQAAATAGISITSLAATGEWLPQHLDLLTKHGITMVRAHEALTESSRTKVRHGISRLDGIGAPAVCHGLWHVPVSVALHGGGWFANRIQLSRVVRSLNRTAARGGLCHVQIDAAALAASDPSRGLRTIERFLKHVERLSQQHRITVETLRGTATRLLPRRGIAAHSILRAA